MARRPKISLEMQAKIAQVAKLRSQTPSNKELAREAGCSVRAIEDAIHRELLRLSTVSCGTTNEMISG